MRSRYPLITEFLRRRWSTENTDSVQIQPESLLKRLCSTPGGVAILEGLLTLWNGVSLTPRTSVGLEGACDSTSSHNRTESLLKRLCSTPEGVAVLEELMTTKNGVNLTPQTKVRLDVTSDGIVARVNGEPEPSFWVVQKLAMVTKACGNKCNNTVRWIRWIKVHLFGRT